MLLPLGMCDRQQVFQVFKEKLKTPPGRMAQPLFDEPHQGTDSN